MDIAQLKAFAESIGFDRIGITSACTPTDFHRYETWVENGYAADLWYVTEASRVEKRRDLAKILPGVRSIIVGGISYAPVEDRHSSDAKFARYAWGKDYHDVVKIRLERLAEWIRARTTTPFEYLTYVDTGPILERSFAERAGVGWIGKNTCVMHESTGSYLYLGEILTTLDLPHDRPAQNHCGTCTRCIDACPTSAFEGPYQLNAAKCISYQTIENRGEDLPEEISNKLNGWVAGCDICQEVCPWNKEALPLKIDELLPGPHTRLSLSELQKLTPVSYNNFFGKSALKRIGLKGLIRNGRVALQKDRRMIRAAKDGNTVEAMKE